MKQLYKAQQEQKDIVYIDETGFESSPIRTHGWATIGERVYGEKSGKRVARTNLIGGFLNKTLLAPMLFEGTCDADVFNEWLFSELLPKLKTGSVIVLDNAPFHKSQLTQDLVRLVGCTLLFLPAYSPHLNPIEKLWANIKKRWRTFTSLPLWEIIKMSKCF